MIRAVCFDLDGTLLPAGEDFFMDRYMRALVQVIPGRTPEQVMRAIGGTLQEVIGDTSGVATIEQRFADGLAQRLDMPYAEQEPHFLRFYEQQFPKLAQYIEAVPEAAQAVRAAKDKGLVVALTTNPVIPGVATRERVRWAGLDEDDFAFVTFYEDCRHTKPNAAYYTEEVLARLGLKPEEVLMVGNDGREDMVPAHALGMHTFLLDVFAEHTDMPRCWDAQGGYAELLAYIKALPAVE